MELLHGIKQLWRSSLLTCHYAKINWLDVLSKISTGYKCTQEYGLFWVHF